MQFKPAAAKRADLAPRLQEGLYVGHHERTGSIVCLTTVGAHFGLAVKRLDGAARWQKVDLMDMKGLPWEMKQPVERQQGERELAPEPVGLIQPSQQEVPPPSVAPGV